MFRHPAAVARIAPLKDPASMPRSERSSPKHPEKLARSQGLSLYSPEARKALRSLTAHEKEARSLMAGEDLRVAYLEKRRRKYGSHAGETSRAPEDPVERDFRSPKPNEPWPTDIAEFELPDDHRRIRLSPIVDRFDGGLPPWSTGLSPDAELANVGLVGACVHSGENERPISHDDRGCHYRRPGLINICKQYGLVGSMSKKGCSPDDAVCGGFFGRLKNEFFHYRDQRGIAAEEFIGQLDVRLVHCNEKREKESLGWMGPMQYRRSLGLTAWLSRKTSAPPRLGLLY